MSRIKVLALLGVLALLAVGVTLRPGSRSAAVAADLGPLQRQAALAPCPRGLGPELPDLRLACLAGGPDVSLRAAPPGVPTLVNVYGSWCGPCQDETPLLVAFHRVAAGRVALVGIDTEEPSRSQALHFVLDFGVHWPALVDDDGVFHRWIGGGVPVTLFLDAAGKVVHVRREPIRSQAALRADVKTWLGVTV